MRRRLAAVLAISVAGTAACSSGTGVDAAHRRLEGTLTVTGNTTCGPVTGHTGLGDGAAVYVADAEGLVLATGRLGIGHVKDAACVRALEVAPVRREPAYRITIGDMGPLTITAADLDGNGGTLDLRLGG